jgi:hypothetical protein
MRHQFNSDPPRSIVHRMYLRINRFIRSHKTISIGFVALLILSQLCLSCTKKDRNTHYVKMVGSCNQQTEIEIFDETGGKDIYGKPANTIDDKHFKNYVNTISKYIFAKIDKTTQCRGNLWEDPQVKLVFVYRPAISRKVKPYQDSLPSESQDTRRLDSPWVKLTLDKSPRLHVNGIFIWNERQFMFDQSLLFGGQISDTKPLLPIDIETFDRWQHSYSMISPSQRSSLLEKLPADIRWLFRYAWISDLGKGGQNPGMSGLELTIEKEKFGYIDLTEAIFNHSLDSSDKKISYTSVLDVKDIFNANKYQIGSFPKNFLLKQERAFYELNKNYKHP